MFKLIKKDFSAFNYVLIFQLCIILTFLSFAFFYDHNGTMMLVILILYPMTLPTILLLNDQSYTTLCCSLPVSRTDYVMAKYIGGGFFATALIVIGLLYGYVVSEYIINSPIPFSQLYTLKGLSLLLIPLILVNSITFPVFFAFTKEKGGILLILLIAIVLLTVLLGLVYFEKTLEPDLYFGENEIFPVLMLRLQSYIDTVGKKAFSYRVFGGTFGLLCASVVTSLFIIHHKDLGQTS